MKVAGLLAELQQEWSAFLSSTHFRVWVDSQNLIELKSKYNKQILFLLPKGKSTNNRCKEKFLWVWHESQKNITKNALVWRGLSNLLFLLFMTKGLAEFLISNKAQLAFKNRRKTPISCSVQLLDVFFNFT